MIFAALTVVRYCFILQLNAFRRDVLVPLLEAERVRMQKQNLPSEFIFGSRKTFDDALLSAAKHDAMLCLISIGLIFFITWFFFESALLAILGLLQVLLTFPIAFFLYSMVCKLLFALPQ